MRTYLKRTTVRRRREFQSFVADKRRLFPFAGLFLAGAAAGVAVYLTAGPLSPHLGSLLKIPPVTGGAVGILKALADTGFSTAALLAVLYLLGLWACAAPFILAVPLFYGVGVGFTEAFYYAMGRSGVLTVATVLLPHSLLTAALLAMAGTESLRLSIRLSRQLLPGGIAPESGLWTGFRLYSLRYLLFLAAGVGISGLDVLLRCLLGDWLP